MKLKRLTLHGFKSFADRTEFDFHDGLTGIIGPNGCGKSNVVDAMKWVLGDQRPSSQRGKEMLDVVFHGCEGRAGAGHAEVSLVLERDPSEIARENRAIEGPVADESSVAGEGEGADGDTGADEAPADASEGESPDEPSVDDGAQGEDVPDASADDAKVESSPEDAESQEVAEPAADAKPVEMQVARRLFRSGESEYLLNGQVVRLKDIKEALMDTGLGVGGYSVMEQGRIDAVLSANPDERRSIFDEAAGISRYKLRRKEALRKLDKTEMNLARVQDLRQEKASRVRSLKIQATRAKTYRETTERLTALEVADAIFETIEQRVAFEEAELAVERAMEEVGALEQKRESARADLVEVEEETRALAARNGELRDLAANLRSEERSRREALESAKGRIEGLDSLAEKSAQESAAVRENVERNRDERGELTRQEQELAQCLDSVASELPELTEKAQQARSAFRDAQKAREQIRVQVLEAMHERTRARNRLRDEQLSVQSLDARHERLRGELVEVEKKLAQSRREGADESSEHGSFEGRLARISERRDAHKQRMVAEERERDAVVGRRQELLTRRSAIASQMKLLEELESSHTGIDEPARELLAEQRGVVGRLVEYVDCPVEVGPALEAVLGTRVQALVVSDFERARSALDSLAERTGGGRLVMIDLERVVSSDVSPTLERPSVHTLPDAGMSLLRFCKLAPPVDTLLRELLEGVTLVRDIASARWLRAQPQYEPRVIVTLRGEVFESAWISGGTAEAAAGLLQRRSSIERLRENLVQVEQGLADTEREQADLDSVLERRAHQFGRYERLAEATRHRQAELEHRLQARCNREQELRVEVAQDRVELVDIEAERSAAIERMLEPMLDGMLLEHDEKRLESEQKRLNEGVQELDVAVQTSQDQLSALQTRKAGLEAELDGLRERCNLLERSLSELQRRAEGLDEQAEVARKERADLEQRIEGWMSQLADFGCRARFVEELCKTVEEGLAELEGETTKLRQSCDGVDADLLRANELRSEKSLESKEIAMRLAHLDEDVWARYRIELGRLRGEIEGYGMWVPGPILGPPLPPGPIAEEVLDGSLKGPPLPPDWYDHERNLPRLWESDEFDRQDSSREIEVLKARMQRMGNVNLAAEDDLERAESEYEQLETNCVDLEDARKQLIETLHRINVESRVLFEQTFEAARVNFQEIFRKLFQGGRADIQLVETDDPLDAGIEIFARPPGKELRSIRLLSGGERSLTALAILFAVFQVKPSPFCILDEVDAALDEANVERFLRVLRDFVGETQFLVVTHHKRTMADCKLLYGVTMPRKGISSRMSVSLEEVESGAVDDVIEKPTGRLPQIRGRGADARTPADPAKARAAAKPRRAPTGDKADAQERGAEMPVSEN